MKVPVARSNVSPQVIVMYILFLLVLQEITFRFLFPLPEVSNFNRVYYSPLQDNVLADRKMLVRNTCFVLPSSPDSIEFISHLNLYGFRDRQWEVHKDKNRRRILFVGDSQMEGALCADEEVIPRFFVKVAEQNHFPVEAMNMGVMGANLYEYIRLIHDAIPVFRPDEVVLLLYANDLINAHLPHNNPQTQPPPPAFQPRFYNRWIPRIVQLALQVTRKEPIAFRWNLKQRDYFPPVPAPNNPWTTRANHLQQFVTPPIAEAMKQGKFSPAAINMLGWKNLFLREPVNIAPELSFLKQYSDQYKVHLSVVYLPDRNMVTNYYQVFEKQYCLICPDTLDLTQDAYQVHRKNIRESCGYAGLPFLDLTPFIKAQEDRGNHLFWNYDEHLRAEGNQLVAEQIFAWFRPQVASP